MESTNLFIWLILAPILLLCEGIVGIFLIAAGMKYRKSFIGIAGLISISLIVVPIICISFGIDLEGGGSNFRNFILVFLLFSWTISYYKRRANIEYSFYGDNFVYNRAVLRSWLSFFISYSLKRQKSREINSLLFYLVYCLMARRTITPKQYRLILLQLRRHR